jgi:hypothetical protein
MLNLFSQTIVACESMAIRPEIGFVEVTDRLLIPSRKQWSGTIYLAVSCQLPISRRSWECSKINHLMVWPRVTP